LARPADADVLETELLAALAPRLERPLHSRSNRAADTKSLARLRAVVAAREVSGERRVSTSSIDAKSSWPVRHALEARESERLGRTVSIDDHRADDLGACRWRCEAPMRRGASGSHNDFGARPACAPGVCVGRAPEIVARERFARVQHRGLQQVALAAALRHPGPTSRHRSTFRNLRRASGFRIDGSRIGRKRLLAALGVELVEDAPTSEGGLDVFDFDDASPCGRRPGPCAIEHLHAVRRSSSRPIEAKVPPRATRHLMALDRLPNARELSLTPSREPRTRVVGGLRHLLFERWMIASGFAVEEVRGGRDDACRTVVDRCRRATGRALLDVRVETRTHER